MKSWLRMIAGIVVLAFLAPLLQGLGVMEKDSDERY